MIYDTPGRTSSCIPRRSDGPRRGHRGHAVRDRGQLEAALLTDSNTIWRAALTRTARSGRASFVTSVIAPKVLVADDDFVYWAASTPRRTSCAAACRGAASPGARRIPSVQSMALEGQLPLLQRVPQRDARSRDLPRTRTERSWQARRQIVQAVVVGGARHEVEAPPNGDRMSGTQSSTFPRRQVFTTSHAAQAMGDRPCTSSRGLPRCTAGSCRLR